MKKLSLLCLFAFGIVLTQCQKETPHKWNDVPDPTGNSTPYEIEKGASVKVDAFGKITNEHGTPIEGVEVSLEGKTYRTDAKGLVQIAQGDAYKELAYIKAKKEGYFAGSRSFIPQAGINRFEIMLVSKGSPQTFESNSGALIGTGKALIQMGAGYIDANGNPYNGTVHAYVNYINPEDPNISIIMPGDLRGANDDGERLLETYGMIAVELESESGEKLEMAEGNPATVKLKVPASILHRAPLTIPLWHFEEGKGIWGQEGEAKLVNDTYIGEVSHFSTWNWDVPFDLTRLDASIVSGTTPIGGFDIKIIRPNGDVRTVKSTDHGKFGGLIPSNENLQFEFWFDGIRVANIPFQTNSEEKVVHSFDVKIPHPAVISGSVKGCLGTNVDRGTVVVNDWFLYPIKDGKYSIELPYVEGKEFRIRAIYLNGESSPTQEFTITSKTIAIEDLSLCSNTDTEDDFSISFKLDGVSYDIKGLKKIVETDSILSFRGGKAALDFSFNNEFLLNFYKDGAWGSSNQFSIKLFENNGYGAIQVEGRERVSVDNLDVVVINRNPYKVLFSGSFIYYDNQSQSIKTVMLTEGQIFEK